MEQLKRLLVTYREQISYLFFGGLATLLNVVLAVVFRWMGLSTAVNTLVDNILCILFAYGTNRTWVFCSTSKGMEALREFGSFVGCRLGTMVMDVLLMWLGVDIIGAMLVPQAWQNLWFLLVKLTAQVLVIVFNYIFSKLIIFKKQ